MFFLGKYFKEKVIEKRKIRTVYSYISDAISINTAWIVGARCKMKEKKKNRNRSSSWGFPWLRTHSFQNSLWFHDSWTWAQFCVETIHISRFEEGIFCTTLLCVFRECESYWGNLRPSQKMESNQIKKTSSHQAVDFFFFRWKQHTSR